MTPANILATTIAAAISLYACYRIIMRLAGWVIDGISDLTRFE